MYTHYYTIHPSINQSPAILLGCESSSLSRETQTAQQPPPAYPGEHRCSQANEKYNLSSVSWVCLRAFSQYDRPETPHPGDDQEASLSDLN